MVRKQKLFTFLILSLLLVAVNVFAVPSRTTYQARIVKPDGYPLEANNVNFQFSILDPSGSCVIYVETYSAVNMANSGGLISFSLGSGVRTYPSSATAISTVFDNSTISYSCQAPGIYAPNSPADARKIVMQFNDGGGWQTLPAMTINAVPYAMYADKADNAALLNGKADSAFVEYSTIPTCATSSHALHYNGAGFTCIATGGGASGTVTAGDITSALGYTPVNPATLSASYTLTTSFSTVTATVNNLGTSVTAVTTTVGGLSASLTSLAGSVAAITSSQWSNVASGIHYSSGNVGLGTVNPGSLLTLSQNTASASPLATNTLLHLVAADAARGGITLDGFGSNSIPTITGRRFSGTAASVSATTNGSSLLSINGSGYKPNGVIPLSTAAITFAAAEDWTASSHGSLITFSTTLTSASAIAERMRIAGNGYVGIGTTTPLYTLDVSGTINATSLKINGVDVGTSSVTSSSVISALGYTPASHTTVTGLSSSMTSVYTTVNNQGTSITTLNNSINGLATSYSALASSMSAITSSQWESSGTAISYSAGKVGIGTSSPVVMLDILSNLGATNETATINLTQYNSTAAATNSSVIFRRARGTVSAPTRLNAGDVLGGIYANGYYDDGGGNAGFATGNHAAIRMIANENYLTSGTLGTRIVFDTTADGTNTRTTKMMIAASGVVGIGTTTPVTQLDVSGGIRAFSDSTAYIVINGDRNGSQPDAGEITGVLSFAADGNNPNATPNNGFTLEHGNYAGSHSLSFNAYNAGVPVERMRIANNGNIGIGTSAPTMLLDLDQATSGTTGVRIRNDNNDPVADARLVLANTSTTAGLQLRSVSHTTAPTALNLYNNGLNPITFYTNGQERFRVDGSGKVGIGIGAPAARLHIAGGTSASGTAPLRFTSGTLTAVAESGAVEYDGNYYYITDNNNVRRAIATVANPGTFDNASTITNSTNITLVPSGSVIVSSTTASTNSQTGALVVNGGLGVAGNVNIGSNLNVSGTINAGSFMSAASLMYLYGTGASYTNAADAYAGGNRGFVADMGASTAWHLMTLKNASGTHFKIENGGYVGIGTDNPDRRLTIIGDGTNYGDDVMIEATNNNSAGTLAQINLAKSRGTPASRTTIMAGDTMGAIAFRGHDGTAFEYGGIIKSVAETNYNVSANADLRLQTTSGGVSVDRMVINSLGNVGIGIASPTARLHVAVNNVQTVIGNVNSAMILQNTNTTSSVLNTLMWSNFDGYANAAISTIQTSAGNVGNRMVLQTKSASGGAWNADQISLSTNGNVGIGTSAPASKLTVSEGDVLIERSTTSPGLRLTNTFTGGRNFAMYSHASGSGGLSRFIIKDNTSGNERLTITDNGDVGINTSAPGSMLDVVSGSIRATRSANPTQYLEIYGGDAVNTAPWARANSRESNKKPLMLQSFHDSAGGAAGNLGFFFQVGTASAPTDVLTIRETGQVGIGVTNPVEKLQVEASTSGRIAISSGSIFSTSGYGVSLESDTDDGVSYLNLHTASMGANAAAFRIRGGHGPSEIASTRNIATFKTDSGYVGIGTDVPNQFLHINQPGSNEEGSPGLFIQDPTTNGNYGGSLYYDDRGGLNVLKLATIDNGSETGYISMNRTNGLIGVNMAGPIAELHIGANIASPTTTGSITRMAFTPYGHTGGPFTIVNRDVGFDAFLDFKYHGSGIHLLTMEDGGKIGMGVSMPTQRLHVGGNMQIDGDTYGGLYGGTRGIWRFSTTDPNFGIFYTEASPDKISFSPNGGGVSTPAMVIHGTNVGVGVSVPTVPLEVYGAGSTPMRLRNSGGGNFWQVGPDAAGNFIVYNNAGTGMYMSNGATTWTANSDRRLKNNIQGIPQSLEKLNQISGVTYWYNSDEKTAPRRVGVIAQDVQKVLPEAVSEKDGFLGVRYPDLVPLVINAVKEFYLKWSQDSEVLHEKVQNLEAENKAMKDYLCQKDPGAPFCQRAPATEK